MKTFLALTRRNIKLFFKDKGMFFVSLITPVVLLVLYATFLANVYKDSFTDAIKDIPLTVPEKLINGTVAAQLLSSLLAVIPITVAFNSNMRLVQDRMIGISKDFQITPVKSSVLSLAYFAATLLTTLIIAFVAAGLGLAYVAIQGWYLTFGDVMYVVLDVVLLALFGTALSSIVSSFLNSQGAMSAVGTVVSAGYGFVCGAYMPIASFGTPLQNVLMCLPGTYGTTLVRFHCMRGVFEKMREIGFPTEVVEGIKDGLDCNIYFFENKVEIWAMFVVMAASIAVFVAAYILINALRKRR